MQTAKPYTGRRAKRSSERTASTGILVLLLLVAGGWGASTSSTSDTPAEEGGGAQPVDTCNDGLDNDGDGLTDTADFECDPTNPMYDGDEDGA